MGPAASVVGQDAVRTLAFPGLLTPLRKALYWRGVLVPRGGGAMKRRTNILLVGILLAFAQFGPAAAGPLEDSEAAYQKGDYAAALQILRPLAEQGNAIAQYDLGLMYDSGQGVQP